MTRKGSERLSSKENTFVEREAKESPFETRQQMREADSRRLEQFFLFTDECPKYLFQYLNQKTISYGARRNVMFLQLFR